LWSAQGGRFELERAKKKKRLIDALDVEVVPPDEPVGGGEDGLLVIGEVVGDVAGLLEVVDVKVHVPLGEHLHEDVPVIDARRLALDDHDGVAVVVAHEADDAVVLQH
jgi:hypothetical protein